MLDENGFYAPSMAHNAFHGSISPCPGVHAGAFLVVKHNSTDSK